MQWSFAALPVCLYNAPVKLRELEKQLRHLGGRIVREGGKLTIWSNGVNEIAIPRHKEKQIYGSQNSQTRNCVSRMVVTARVIMSKELTIPDDILEAAGLTERDCLIELAVHLYAERRITLGQALRLSQLTRAELEKELARRDISLYTVEDLSRDVAALKELGRL